jgi:hypothetical protein
MRPVRKTTSSNCGTICPGLKVPREPPFFPVGQVLNAYSYDFAKEGKREHTHKEVHVVYQKFADLLLFATFWNCKEKKLLSNHNTAKPKGDGRLADLNEFIK